MALSTSKFEELYKKLNPMQKKAVDTIEGPVMVVAGPGTGKTQILTLRIANILLKTDTDPDNILALTFTESGAYAMRKRLVDIIGTPAYKVHIQTFHGFCNEIIKRYPEEFPRIISSTNATEIDQIDIVERIIDISSFEYIKPFGDAYYYVRPTLSNIRDLKREGVTPGAFLHALDAQEAEFKDLPDVYHEKGAHKGKMKGEYKDVEKKLGKNKELAVVYAKYEEALAGKKLYDYEDMILEVVNVMRHHDDFLLTLQEHYQYILADEHQDTNNAQNTILELLSGFHERPNLFIVGDEKQAIFRFQGATLNNFLYFKELYEDVVLINLEDNYRSTQAILDSAHSVIMNTKDGDEKLRVRLNAHSAHPSQHIDVYAFAKADYEYRFLAQDIAKNIALGMEPSEIAVLYRDNRDVEEIVRTLEKTAIPFVVESDQDILRNPLIRKLILLIRTVASFGDSTFLAEALHIDFLALNELDVYRVISFANKQRLSLFEVIHNETFLAEAGCAMPTAFLDVYKKLAHWNSLSKNGSFLEFMDAVMNESGMLRSLLSGKGSLDKLHVLDSFFNELRSLSENNKDYSIIHFIKYLDVLNQYGLLVRRSGESVKKGVRLMTTHKSKGLEFDHVYIVGCYDGHWGNRTSRSLFKVSLKGVKDLNEKGNNDDERRLFYVALTRARKNITLTYSKENAQGKSQLPSQFISELSPDLVTFQETLSIEEEMRNTVEQKYAPKMQHGAELYDKEFLNSLFSEQGLSVTSLNNYLTCPWRYFYTNLVRIPKPQEKSAMFGTAVHAALNSFFNAYKEDRPVSSTLLLSVFESELIRMPLSKTDFEEALEKGKIALAGYFKTYDATWSKNIFNEFDIRGVHLQLEDGSDILLRGKLDKVEVLDTAGHVNVVDYKTGKPKSRNDIEGKTESSEGNYKRQLIFYKILVDSAYPDKYKMVSGEIDFIEPALNGMYKKEKFDILDSEVVELEEEVRKVAKEIIALDFWNVRCDDAACEYCKIREMMK